MQSLLVANRGEIACRIFRTARRLGIRTIAVYSQADATARHVREADVAVCIGAAPARESYLNIERIVDAARMTRAQAVHPGYGFLSENAPFAQACVRAGLRFVGPPAEAIASMGSKDIAKARMRAAGVPVLPGYEGPGQTLEELEAQARKLPLPLMIKPAAGGGGKGMRIVTEASQIGAALAAARRIAQSAFAQGTLLLERFLARPRHVEVQVFADAHGNTVHLGDRDCSLQRRHQKVIEEAPAPGVPEEVRAAMREAALVVAREIGYVGAGTVEFLYEDGRFYFLEMNTRLQVEHTVTEAITGLDLVEWQLRVADGETLPLAQSAICLSGHAIQARVCAEDPARDFLPSAGILSDLHWPEGDWIRVDAGFDCGDRVPIEYDSLLGKVIAWAPSRDMAVARLAGALDRTRVAGVHTNERWLARILRTEPFAAARHNVAFLAESGPVLASSRTLGESATGADDAGVLMLAALAAHRYRPGAAGGPWEIRDGFSPNLPGEVELTLSRDGREFRIVLGFGSSGLQSARIANGESLPLADFEITEDEVCIRAGAVRLRAQYHLSGHDLHVWLGAEHFEFRVEDPREREYSTAAAGGRLATPLPGVVVSIGVASGQKVAAGEALMVIEAMKMEHTIAAPTAGTIGAIHYAQGDRVPEGKDLLELIPEGADPERS